MLTRRSFLSTVAAGGTALALSPIDVLAGVRSVTADRFNVHPFIEANPSAVFIMRTAVDVKTNHAAIRQAGLTFGSSVFVPVQSGGIPISHMIALKPNIVMMPDTDVDNMGIVTDPYFVEGIIESIKALGVAGDHFYLREVNDPGQFSNSGYAQMAARTGADIRALDAPVGAINEADLQWVDLPDGQWFTRIPYLWPVNAPDSWLLNIAKLKTHLMGMTLCAKNIQGAIAMPYVQHCVRHADTMLMDPVHIRAGAKQRILDAYNTHVAQGIPRWGRPGEDGGLWHETWGTRCLDNNAVTKPGLNIIEAVYGREGPFTNGPAENGKGIDHMVNLVIFGKNPFHVDAVGYWLGGHEPGNVGSLHMAVERGLSVTFDPSRIPIYEWTADGSAMLTSLSGFPRTPLRTQYLLRDYDGQTEESWHLLNEPYDYTATHVAEGRIGLPGSFVLHQNFPNPFNPSTSIPFELPRAGNVRIEVMNVAGECIGILVDEYRPAGAHLIRWDASRHPSGVYFCRALFGGKSMVKSMIVVK
ncbi:MAG: DUF362 domain-containing protein [Ignavibacteriae bacterium]|nr:DUF362 domain-containing protein [Ignavibacteriota bacterium]